MSLPSGPGVEHPGQRHDLREAERVGRRPLAGRLAVLAAAHGHQRVRRRHAEHEQAAGSQLHADLAGDARLRRREQRLDVAARGVELLAFVDQLAVDPGSRAPSRATACSVSVSFSSSRCDADQDLGGRRLERDAALRADDRVAEVDAAADAVARAERPRASRSARRGRAARRRARPARRARTRSRSRSHGCGFSSAPAESTHADSGMLPFESSVSVPPIVTPQRPRFVEYAEPRVGTGILRSSRNFTCAGRCHAWSRTGARIVSSGATAFSTISNRTWSLPAAVQPCATVSEPSSFASCARYFACRPRSAPTHSGYMLPRRTLPMIRNLMTLSKNSRPRLDRAGGRRRRALARARRAAARRRRRCRRSSP